MGSFDYGVSLDSRMVGEVIQSPVNLETVTLGQWLAADGRDIERGRYPALAALFPINTTTSTLRTLNAIPNNRTIASDSTNFLLPGVAGTSPLQASADAASWSTSATWTAATSPIAIINAGTRFVMAGSGGDLTQPYVANVDQTAANIVAKSNWTATTGGTTPTTSLVKGLVYSPTANAGAGRTLLIRNGALTTASGLFYMNDGATAWNACSGGSTVTRACGCWTGQKFIVFTTATSVYQTSSDGETFADAYLPMNVSTVTDCASDGAGTVVIVVVTKNSIGVLEDVFIVSKDHGTTWRIIPIPHRFSQNGKLGFANGLFWYAQSYPAALFSKDAICWFEEPVGNRGLYAPLATVTFDGMGYKGGVWLGICGNQASTAALSFVEDASKFRIPLIGTENVTAVGFTPATMQYYIKARSK